MPKPGLKPASGVIVVEPDGRVWIVEPKDHWGGYEHTFPKGKAEPHLTLQQNALKEAYEESGLQVELVGHVDDVHKTTSTTRYYLARRTGGAPWDAHWESDTVKLVPPDVAAKLLNQKVDKDVLEAALAKAAEPPPAPAQTLAETILHTKVGAQKGSNQGGFYEGADGVKRYVKVYADAAQAHCEHLANNIYKDLGLVSPKSATFEHGGKLHYASEILEGRTLADVGLTEERAKKFLDGFVADVLVGNWDAAGAGLDNAFVLADGSIARIDNGGTFLFRAQAGRKPDALLNAITEWDVFFSSKNPAYQRIAKAAGINGPEDMRASVLAQIEAVQRFAAKEGGWSKYVETVAKDLDAAEQKKVAKMLEARTALLEQKAAELRQPPKAPPAPGAARFVAKQYSSVSAAPDRELTSLPESNVIKDWYGKVPQSSPTATYSGEKHSAYVARARKAVEKVSDTSKSAIRSFTGSGYIDVRDSEESGKPSAKAKAIYEAFKTATPEPGTVFRAIRGLDQRVVEKYMRSEVFQLGRTGGATSSTSWCLDASIDGFMGGNHDGGPHDYKILFVLNQQTGIPIETLSGISSEREILLSRDAKFRVTGLSRPAGMKHVLVVEGEEIVGDASPQAVTPKPKRTRKKKAPPQS